MFNPQSETWTPMASQQVPRVYHSTAVLLPDGRVLSAGHDNGAQQTTAEIYSPPYLFQGPRPTISSAPSSLSYGGQFHDLDAPGIVDPASGLDPAQLDDPFPARGPALHGPLVHRHERDHAERDRSGERHRGAAGPYMLFLVSSSGVPSVASFLSVTGGTPSPPAPTISGFSPTSGSVGSVVDITGTNFTGASAVTFNNVAATQFSVASPAHHRHGAVGRYHRPDPRHHRRRHRHQHHGLHRDHHSTAELSVSRRGARRLPGRLLAPGGDVRSRRGRDGQRRQLPRRRDARRCWCAGGRRRSGRPFRRHRRLQRSGQQRARPRRRVQLRALDQARRAPGCHSAAAPQGGGGRLARIRLEQQGRPDTGWYGRGRHRLVHDRAHRPDLAPRRGHEERQRRAHLHRRRGPDCAGDGRDAHLERDGAEHRPCIDGQRVRLRRHRRGGDLPDGPTVARVLAHYQAGRG